MPPIRGSAPKLCRSSGSNAQPYDHSSPFSTPKKVRQSNTPGNYQSARIQSSPSTPGRLLGNLLESPLRLRNGRQAAKTHDEQQSVDGVTEAQYFEHESDDISSFYFSPIRLSTPLLDLECEKPSLRMPLNMTLDATFDAFRTPSTARDRGLVLAPLDETQSDHVSPPGERDIGARIDPSTDNSESNPFYSPPHSPLPLSSILNDAALTLLLDDEQTSDAQDEREGNTLSTNGLDWMYANDIRSTATLEELRLLDVYQLVKPMLVPRPPPSPIIEHNRLEDINAAVRDDGIHDGLDYDAELSSRAIDTAAHAIAQALWPSYMLSEVQELLLRKTTEGDYEATVSPADLQR